MLNTYEAAVARCWLEIDLSALASNAASVQALAGKQIVIPVLKGNAYGMGSVTVARELVRRGLTLFATAIPIEALELKSMLPEIQLLILGITERPFIEPALKAGLLLTMASMTQARMLSAEATRLNLPAKVHIKINTGLNRIGFDDARDIQSAIHLPGIEPQGIFTHLALHGEASDRAQLRAFTEIADALPLPLMRHALDSIGLCLYPDTAMDAVRIGAWLWGMPPKGYSAEGCVPIQTFKARILQIRALEKGALVGYDDHHPLEKASRVATISAGYADGYPRLHSIGYVEIHGKKAPLCGLVGMDSLMADISSIPEAKEDDEVILLGHGISAFDYADWAGTNRNDAITRITRRVPRIYISEGKPKSISNYFTPCEEVQ